jgi:hypothetical protein
MPHPIKHNQVLPLADLEVTKENVALKLAEVLPISWSIIWLLLCLAGLGNATSTSLLNHHTQFVDNR